MGSLRVGLTGGIGSGKSLVAERWQARGALIVDADVLARDVVAPGTDGLAAIAALWPAVISADGALDRKALAALVFADDAARRALNEIVHPRVRARAAELDANAPDEAIVVHVVPLLFESDYGATFPLTVAVIAPHRERIARVAARDGIDPHAVQSRMDAQIDPDEARRRASFVIENDGDLATLEARADDVYYRLLVLRG